MNQVIQDQSEFDNVCTAAAKMPWVSLDTEFRRVSTYYPKLCLLQIATADTTVCIDVLNNLDFSLFKLLLMDATVTKIFHSARQDLEALFVTFGIIPETVFDTQLAASLCGYGEQIAYAELTEELCSVVLSKSHTRIDWSRRPLTDSEILYALDDVKYLGPIYHELSKQLVTLGRITWMQEDCDRLVRPDMLTVGSKRAIEKIQHRARGLDQMSQSIAFELALWREATAQAQDHPREWILHSDAIIAITQICPYKRSDFETHPRLTQLKCDRWIGEILDTMKLGRVRSETYFPLRESRRPTVKERRLEKILWNRLEAVCLEAGIPTAAVAPRRDIRSLAHGRTDLGVLVGWRKEFIGRELRDLFRDEGVQVA